MNKDICLVLYKSAPYKSASQENVDNMSVIEEKRVTIWFVVAVLETMRAVSGWHSECTQGLGLPRNAFNTSRALKVRKC
jgi:hypothetical protein